MNVHRIYTLNLHSVYPSGTYTTKHCQLWLARRTPGPYQWSHLPLLLWLYIFWPWRDAMFSASIFFVISRAPKLQLVRNLELQRDYNLSRNNLADPHLASRARSPCPPSISGFYKYLWYLTDPKIVTPSSSGVSICVYRWEALSLNALLRHSPSRHSLTSP